MKDRFRSVLKDSEKLEREARNVVIDVLTHSFYASGHLTDEDISDPLMHITKLKELIERADVQPKLDHRPTLTKLADRLCSDGNMELSIVLYATYFEHTLNYLIHFQIIERLKKRSNTAREMIKSANMDAKLTWLLDLISLPPINEEHRKVILQISNERNAFIHYKWNPTDTFGTSKAEKERLLKLIMAAKKAKAYIERYDSRILYGGNKSKVKQAIQRMKT